MSIRILGDLPKGVCITCGQETARIQILNFVEGYDDMKELKWKYNCFKCDFSHRKINKCKKQIAELEQKIEEEEFILFCRKK